MRQDVNTAGTGKCQNESSDAADKAQRAYQGRAVCISGCSNTHPAELAVAELQCAQATVPLRFYLPSRHETARSLRRPLLHPGCSLVAAWLQPRAYEGSIQDVARGS